MSGKILPPKGVKLEKFVTMLLAVLPFFFCFCLLVVDHRSICEQIVQMVSNLGKVSIQQEDAVVKLGGAISFAVEQWIRLQVNAIDRQSSKTGPIS